MPEYEHFEWLCKTPLNNTTLLIITYLDCLPTLPNIWKTETEFLRVELLNQKI